MDSDKQYITDLVEISGGVPKGFYDKIALGLVLNMNTILYDKETAHQKAEEYRQLRQSHLETISTF